MSHQHNKHIFLKRDKFIWKGPICISGVIVSLPTVFRAHFPSWNKIGSRAIIMDMSDVTGQFGFRLSSSEPVDKFCIDDLDFALLYFSHHRNHEFAIRSWTWSFFCICSTCIWIPSGRKTGLIVFQRLPQFFCPSGVRISADALDHFFQFVVSWCRWCSVPLMRYYLRFVPLCRFALGLDSWRCNAQWAKCP